MSKHIFAQIAKIGEEVRAAEAIKVELFDAREAAVDRAKAFNAASAGYDMVMKAKVNFQKTMYACDSYITKYFKELSKFPPNSPNAVALKNAIEDMRGAKKEAENLLALAKRFPTF